MSSGASDITQWGAVEIAAAIASRTISSGQAVESYIRRIERVDPLLNAVVVRRFDEARREAQRADEAIRQGNVIGPLHGVPITVKESFFLAGTPSCAGLTHLRDKLAAADGHLVRLLRAAGAVIVGKTNAPQLLITHGSDNPVYGRTHNPWCQDRTPGGSTSGEAAIIAAQGSPLGLGGDLGGSIRIPCHFCGIHGLLPTRGRLTRSGHFRNFRGMEVLGFQPGPMARRVEDLALALRVLTAEGPPPEEARSCPAPPRDPSAVDPAALRIALWTDDGYFPASPAVRRAVERAGRFLAARGAQVESYSPPNVEEAIRLFYGILSADGAADARRLLRGSVVDPRLRSLMRLSGLPRWLRSPLGAALKLCGQRLSRDVLLATGSKSADEYWQLTDRLTAYAGRFFAGLDEGRFDAWICPPFGLPAPPPALVDQLLPAASYSLLGNVLGVPCGVVAATRVEAGEESDRAVERDRLTRLARAAEQGSAGLPVGVQVAARPWREDIVLAVMAALEEDFRQQPLYPTAPPLV